MGKLTFEWAGNGNGSQGRPELEGKEVQLVLLQSLHDIQQGGI